MEFCSSDGFTLLLGKTNNNYFNNLYVVFTGENTEVATDTSKCVFKKVTFDMYLLPVFSAEDIHSNNQAL